MLRFMSKYEGEDFDEAIKWVKQQKEFATTQILESTPEAKVDLDTLTFEQGTFIIHYYTNSYNDSSSNPINLDVIFIEGGDILQRYDYLGNTVQRFRKSGAWTEWAPVKSFMVVGEDDEVPVSVDTLVLREITTPVNEFFKSET